jgi:hypothetical protein
MTIFVELFQKGFHNEISYEQIGQKHYGRPREGRELAIRDADPEPCVERGKNNQGYDAYSPALAK